MRTGARRGGLAPKSDNKNLHSAATHFLNLWGAVFADGLYLHKVR